MIINVLLLRGFHIGSFSYHLLLFFICLLLFHKFSSFQNWHSLFISLKISNYFAIIFLMNPSPNIFYCNACIRFPQRLPSIDQLIYFHCFLFSLLYSSLHHQLFQSNFHLDSPVSKSRIRSYTDGLRMHPLCDLTLYSHLDQLSSTTLCLVPFFSPGRKLQLGYIFFWSEFISWINKPQQIICIWPARLTHAIHLNNHFLVLIYPESEYSGCRDYF